MAGARVTIEVEGGARVLAALARLVEAGTRRRTVYADIGEYLLQSHEERWDRQVSPEGVPWAPLSEAHLARKRTKGKPVAILVLDQHLKDLACNESDDGLELGTPWVYGATHQFGAPARGIPARPFLGLSEDDRAEVLTLVTEWLENLVEGRA